MEQETQARAKDVACKTNSVYLIEREDGTLLDIDVYGMRGEQSAKDFCHGYGQGTPVQFVRASAVRVAMENMKHTIILMSHQPNCALCALEDILGR